MKLVLCTSAMAFGLFFTLIIATQSKAALVLTAISAGIMFGCLLREIE